MEAISSKNRNSPYIPRSFHPRFIFFFCLSTFPILLFFHPFHSIGQNKAGVIFIGDINFIGSGLQWKSAGEVPPLFGILQIHLNPFCPIPG